MFQYHNSGINHKIVAFFFQVNFPLNSGFFMVLGGLTILFSHNHQATKPWTPGSDVSTYSITAVDECEVRSCGENRPQEGYGGIKYGYTMGVYMYIYICIYVYMYIYVYVYM